MVRVLSVHHFTSQDVIPCREPVASTVAGNLLLLASNLHQVNVRDLSNTQDFFSFPTVDLVCKMEFSAVGRYLVTLEKREEEVFVRVYINWWNQEAVQQPMRARVAAVTPGMNKEEQSFEMIEILCSKEISNISVCPSTGNLVILRDSTITIYRYTLANQPPSKFKYIDFQECIKIHLNYSPTEIKITEDIIACLTASMAHVFKVKLEESSEESVLRSLSMYSFSSESETSMDCSPMKAGQPTAETLATKLLNNVTERRRIDSSCERDLPSSAVVKHPNHVTLGRRRSEDNSEMYEGIQVIPNPLVDREERELGSLSSPHILEQLIGPCPTPPHISVTVELIPSAFIQSTVKKIQGVALTLVSARISEVEKNVERLGLLRLQPVYWREYRVRRSKVPEADSATNTTHNPLQSLMHSHLMSMTLMFASVHEGYLYHIPGHVRRVGKGVGVQKIGTYPFTSPVNNIVLEPFLLHALTDTGLETYTLRSGYHTVREAQKIDDVTNACPPNSTPICLIGLRPFLGVMNLLLGTNRLVLLSSPTPHSLKQADECEEDWTVYSLHLPPSTTVYQDMLTVAEMNAGAPHGHLQLLCEAHMVLRTSLHRLTWMQVMKPNGVEVSSEEIDALRNSYKESCLKLADHYLQYEEKRKYSLATPYYRMSGLPIMEVIERLSLENPLQAGVRNYVEEIVLRPCSHENLMDTGVAEKIIELLGENALSSLVHLILNSAILRGFKSKKSLEYIEAELISCKGEGGAELAVAAVLIGGSGDWLSSVPMIELSSVLLKNHQLLFDQPQNQPECFSELAIVVRLTLPVVFCELCVSLIESNICTLGQVLQLLLQTFMSLVTSPTSADNAAILQLFLETYFIELLAQQQNIQDILPLSGDQQQSLVTLLRSYLAGLSNPIPAPQIDDLVLPCQPGEFYSSREEYLDLLPPFLTESTDQCKDTLLKLQSLLCSGICDETCKETVIRYVEENPGIEGALSLKSLCSDDSATIISHIFKEAPGALCSFCKYKGEDISAWETAIKLLHSSDTQESKLVMSKLLEEVVTMYTPDKLLDALPPDQQFQETIIQSRRNQQADRLQQLIVSYSIVAKI